MKLQVLSVVVAACGAVGVGLPANAAPAADLDISVQGVSLHRQDGGALVESVSPGEVVDMTMLFGVSAANASPWTFEIDLPEGFTAETGLSGCRALLEGRKLVCEQGPYWRAHSLNTQVQVRADASVCPGTEAKGYLRVNSPEDSNPANNEREITFRVS